MTVLYSAVHHGYFQQHNEYICKKLIIKASQVIMSDYKL